MLLEVKKNNCISNCKYNHIKNTKKYKHCIVVLHFLIKFNHCENKYVTQ